MKSSNTFNRIQKFDEFLKKVDNIYYYEAERMDRAYQIVANARNFAQAS